MERKKRRSAWEIGKRLFGRFASGTSDLSARHAEILREKLYAKHRRRRSRTSDGDKGGLP